MEEIRRDIGYGKGSKNWFPHFKFVGCCKRPPPTTKRYSEEISA
jgi:hypothetical protein